MNAGIERYRLDDGVLDLPPPGSGETVHRWNRLAELAEVDLVAARLAEAHADAVAILTELGGSPAQPDQLWGVWAGESSGAVLRACGSGHATALEGVKAWCSGARLCSHALVTAQLPDGERGLFAVELSQPAVKALPSTWRNVGMQAADTRSVQFVNAQAVQVGRPGNYLNRPGFWHGAAGVAACWLGGARAVAAPLYRCGATVSANDHRLAHLGAVDAAIAAAQAMLMSTACRIDADPADRAGTAERDARRMRAVTETAVEEVIARTGRALGAAPLALDGAHARRVADLTVYVRQSHAEVDLAALGRLVAGQGGQ